MAWIRPEFVPGVKMDETTSESMPPLDGDAEAMIEVGGKGRVRG